MKSKRRIPRFTSEAQEARFWATHDLADYLHDTKAVDDLLDLHPALAKRIRERARKRLLTIRLEDWRVQRAKQIAHRQKVPYQRLLRDWIAQGIDRETRRSNSA